MWCHICPLTSPVKLYPPWMEPISPYVGERQTCFLSPHSNSPEKCLLDGCWQYLTPSNDLGQQLSFFLAETQRGSISLYITHLGLREPTSSWSSRRGTLCHCLTARLVAGAGVRGCWPLGDYWRSGTSPPEDQGWLLDLPSWFHLKNSATSKSLGG